MSVRRPPPDSVSRGISIDGRFVVGERVYKFDNLTDQFEGRFVYLALSSNGLVLYWRQQEGTGEVKLSEAIYVDEIIDVFVGCCNETVKQKVVQQRVDGQIKRIFAGTFTAATCTLSSCFITVMFGSDAVNPSALTFLTDSDESAKLWVCELRRVSVKLTKELPIIGCFYYWQRLFTKVRHSTNNDAITVNDLIDALIPSKNKEDRKELDKSLRCVPGFKDKKGVPCTSINDDFIFSCYRAILDRSDVQSIFDECFEGEWRASADQFVKYLRKEHCDTRLNELLYPRPSHSTAAMILDEFNKSDRCLTVDTYLRFLLSSYNIAMLRDHLVLRDGDMHKPLSHYFINSSHNTYLKSYQVNAKSSVEIYRYVLLSGCRSVELDCWDGSNGEPIITHGPSQLTRVTPVLFRDVIVAIAETAFIASSFPVILSFENHCSVKQQRKMAAYCREIFGDMLLVDPLSDYPIRPGVSLPSPNALRKKILVKNKKVERKGVDVPVQRNTRLINSMSKQDSMESSGSDRAFQESELEQRSSGASAASDPEEDRDQDEQTFANETSLPLQSSIDEKFTNNNVASGEIEVVANELSDLVNYMRAMGKLNSFEESEAKQMSSELFSMTETRAYELVKQSPIEFVNHNKRQITRVYPKGKRVDSSNFWPIKFWNCGCQMTAINMQTPDVPFQMNSAFFEQNGRCGYVLKPSLMRKADAKFNPFETRNMDLVVPAYLSLTVISAQMLSTLCERRPSTYVEVSFYGHFRDLSTFSKRKYRTKTVNDNGINAIYTNNFFQEEFKYEKIIFPSMASIQVAVYEDNGRMLGQRFLQVASIQPGFRHIILRNGYNRPIGPVTLFVRFCVHDYVDEKSQYMVEALQNPIAALKKEQAASAAFVNPIETLKIRESMLLALEESEPRALPALPPLESFHSEQNDDGTDFSFDKLSLSGDLARDIVNGNSLREEIPLVSFHQERHSFPNERLKERFYLEDMDLPFATLEEFAVNPKVVKLEKNFRKKYPNVLEAIEGACSSLATPKEKITDDIFAAFAKYEKERSDQIALLAEHNRKKLLKRIDMAHKCEAKQLMKLNHQKRFHEQSRSIERSTEGTEEMREKYVKLGVEEQRRLNKVKEKRVKEIDDKLDVLKLEVNVRMEDRLRKTTVLLCSR